MTRTNKTRSNRLFSLGYLVLLVYFLLISPVSALAEEYEKELSMTYAGISIQLTELDLPMRRVHFNVSGTLGLNFNSTNDVIRVSIYTRGSYIGQTQMKKATSGSNKSDFQIDSNMSDFSGYFFGGPETYPFDYYEFNFSLCFQLSEVSLSQNDVTANCYSNWPLRAQFEGPLDKIVNVTRRSSGPCISLCCTLRRPLWRGYATLMPPLLIFALVGFSAILRNNKQELRYRLMVYLSVLTLSIGYSFSLQSTLPEGRYYLSFPEATIYGVIGSATLFLITSLISYQMKLTRPFTDIIAAIFSIALLSFLFFTFYLAPHVDISKYQLEIILSIEWTALILLFLGTLILALQKLKRLVNNYRSGRKLGELYTQNFLNDLTKWVYIIGFCLHFSCVVIATYTVWTFGPQVEPNIIRRIVFQVTEKNIPLTVAAQSILTVAIVSLFYFIPRRKGVQWASDVSGITFLGISTFNFLAVFALIRSNLILLAFVIISCLVVIFSVLFGQLRKCAHNKKWGSV